MEEKKVNKDVVKVDDKAIVRDGKNLKIVENFSNLDEILKTENKSVMIDDLFYNNIECQKEKLEEINYERERMKDNSYYFAFAFASIFVTLLLVLGGAPADVVAIAPVFGTSCVMASVSLIASNVILCKRKISKLQKEYMKTEEVLEVLDSLKMKSEREKNKLIEESVTVQNLDLTSGQVGKLVDYKIARNLVVMYQKGLISSNDFLELMNYDMKDISANILENDKGKIYKKVK